MKKSTLVLAFMAMAAFGSVQAQDMSRGDADKQQQKKENMSQEDRDRMREERQDKKTRSTAICLMTHKAVPKT